MCPFCVALVAAWSARGYWLLSELLCCYARCCRSEGSCQWTCSAFVHTRSFWILSLKCLPSVTNRNAVVSGRYGHFKRRVTKIFHVIASAGMTHTYRFILFCHGVFVLVVHVRGGLSPTGTSLPFSRSWESLVMSSPGPLLLMHTD